MEIFGSNLVEMLSRVAMFILVQVLVYLILSKSSNIFSKTNRQGATRSGSFKPARSDFLRKKVTQIQREIDRERERIMAEQPESAAAGGGGAPPPDAQLFGLLSHLLQQVETLTNQEEVELRSKIEALGLEVTKVPTSSSRTLDELEIAKELDKLSNKLDDVDEMISSAMAADPQVRSLLSSTADVWMPVITATSEQRRNFTASVGDEANGKTAE